MQKILIERRIVLGLSHEAIAEKLGISRSYYNRLENGMRQPSVSLAKKIANELDFDWTIFFEQKTQETNDKC